MSNEEIIEQLTKLLIQQDFEDKQKNKTTYIKKTECYKSLIVFFKKYKVDLNMPKECKQE